MRLLHAPARTTATFDGPNLVSCAGLASLAQLADRLHLHDLIDEKLHVEDVTGANPAVKVTTLLAGMVAGADSIDDMDLLRHGGMSVVFNGDPCALHARIVSAPVRPRQRAPTLLDPP